MFLKKKKRKKSRNNYSNSLYQLHHPTYLMVGKENSLGKFPWTSEFKEIHNPGMQPLHPSICSHSDMFILLL